MRMKTDTGASTMHLTCQTCLSSLSCLFAFQQLLLHSAVAFSAPPSPIVALFGRDLTIPCTFTPEPSMSLLQVVVTWQLVGSDKVVHSYYYQQDQLAKQDPAYRNRTQLFPGGLLAGNASLLLRNVRLEDSAQYMCSVSSVIKAICAIVKVIIAAPYSEPHLTFDLRNCPSSGLLSVFAMAGYPKAEVEWVNEQGYNVSEQTKTEFSTGPLGLYSVRSWLVVPKGVVTNYTFILRNRLLKQKIIRSLAVTGFCHMDGPSRRDRHLLFTIIPAVLILALVLLALGVYLRGQKSESELAG
ncbi:CD276 antigen-like [Heterodontus francisci]|uniref:CD276 antigen-like n=1 Tax=Heterodontus francisci TaxID=7792 RepID=UPI00355BCF80